MGIDPGTRESAYVIWNGQEITDMGKVSNKFMLSVIEDHAPDPSIHCGMEMVKSFGPDMPVGDSIFLTVFWLGRFFERWQAHGGPKPTMIYRQEVKKHFKLGRKISDTLLRHRIIRMFDGDPDKKIIPAELKGVSGDCWSALGIAITLLDQTCRRLRHWPPHWRHAHLELPL